MTIVVRDLQADPNEFGCQIEPTSSVLIGQELVTNNMTARDRRGTNVLRPSFSLSDESRDCGQLRGEH